MRYRLTSKLMFTNLKADIARLGNGKASLRGLIRGLMSQGFQALLVYRFFNWLHRYKTPAQPFRFVIERFIEITTGISIPAECVIGKGLRIHHFGGIILHPSVVLGDNCTLYHGVTIGDGGGYGGAGTICDNVIIGTGAKIIGEITIGNNSKIGANAVVNTDIQADTIVHSPKNKESQIASNRKHKPSGEQCFRKTMKTPFFAQIELEL